MKITSEKIEQLLGEEANSLLQHTCKTFDKETLHRPSSDFVDKVFLESNRNPQTLKSIQSLFNNGRLAGTGYLSILPVDQGIEHSGGSAFAPNPIYFDPENILKLALEAGCNGVATTMGSLAISDISLL